MARGDTTKRWDSLLVILARDNPSAASGLVDRILRLPKRTGELKVRMLLEDGLRLVSLDTARAARRFREAMAAGGSREVAGRAGLALAKLGLIGVSRPQDLAPVVKNLKSLAVRYRMDSDEISRFGAAVADVHVTATSVTPDTAQGDLRLFLAAESARDSLAAPRLAEAIFRRIPEEWPLSPYAPKAILAAQQLNPAWADSARALLDEQYFASPYLATIRGEATPEYRQLEDSLGAFAASLAVRRPPEHRRRPVPATLRERRPRPESGGSRVPEP
jgi:hypothetical protein